MKATSKNKLFILTIAILLLANIAMLLFFVWLKEPQEKEHPRQKGRNPVSELLENKIGFNKQQMSQYEQMKQLHKEKMKPLFEDIRMAKEQFYSNLNSPAISDSAINAASETIGEKQRLLDMQIFNHFRNLRNLCTAEQRPAFDTLIQGVLHKMVIAGRRGGQSRNDTLKKQD